MPDTELNVRVVTLEDAIADVSRNPCDFLVINRECHPPEIPRPSKLLLERLHENGAADLLIVPTTLVELEVHLPLGRDRDRFIAGELVMMAATKVHETPERDVGGQDVVGLERRARDGLYVAVAMATERLRACADFSEHRKMGTEARRGEIFERLQPLLGDVSATNCFDEGQARIKNWYPGPTAYRTMKSAYAAVLQQLRDGAKPALLQAEQLNVVRTVGMVYAKAKILLEAQHTMSAELRKMIESDVFAQATPEVRYQMQAKFLREQAPAQHQELAHNKQGGPSLAQLMRAAAAMDLNASSVYGNFLFYKTELDCAMYLGRAARGVGAMFEPKHIVALKRFLAQADEADGRDPVDLDIHAARRLRDLALQVKTRADWDEFFAIAEPDGREFWVTKPL
jgi:hypothetical protein